MRKPTLASPLGWPDGSLPDTRGPVEKRAVQVHDSRGECKCMTVEGSGKALDMVKRDPRVAPSLC